MKTNKKTIVALLLSAAIIAGTIIFLLWYDKKAKKEQDGTSPGIGGGGSTSSTSNVFPLKVGSTGAKVRELQSKLNVVVPKKAAYLYVKPTYLGVEINSLVVDGIFGPRTLAFLQYAFSDTNKTQITETEFNNLK
jgi:peptidoglycan hydrolase-like protein with peptidoglycan-binding domain